MLETRLNPRHHLKAVICFFVALLLGSCVRQRDGSETALRALNRLSENASLSFLKGVKITNAAQMELRGWNLYVRGTGSIKLLDSVKSSNEWIDIAISKEQGFLKKRLAWWEPHTQNPCYVFQKNGSELGFHTGLSEGGLIAIIISANENTPELATIYIEMAFPMQPVEIQPHNE